MTRMTKRKMTTTISQEQAGELVASIFSGPCVWVERVMMADGRHTWDYLPVLLAAATIDSPQNGVTVASLTIHWGKVLDEYTRSA